MLDSFYIVTATHHQFSLQQVGEFAIPVNHDDDLKNRLQSIKSAMDMDELYYLSTCNRVLYFFVTARKVDDNFLETLLRHINPQFSIDPEALQIFRKADTVGHLYEVASSLDSMVVGEREILKQLKDAFQQQSKWKLRGDNIRMTIESVIRIAKEVYSHTNIGERSVSVVSLSVQKLLQKRIRKDAPILLIGAGKTVHLMCKYLKKHRFSNIHIYNRSIDNAQRLAEMTGGKAGTLKALRKQHNLSFKAIISCTGSSGPVLTEVLYRQLIGGDQSEKILVDLAVPADIETSIYQQFPVYKITIDDLKELAKDNLRFRQQEVLKAKLIIEEARVRFQLLFGQRLIERAFHKIPLEIRSVSERALDEVFKKDIEKLDDSAKEVLFKVVSYFEKKCVSIPMRIAKEAVLPK